MSEKIIQLPILPGEGTFNIPKGFRVSQVLTSELTVNGVTTKEFFTHAEMAEHPQFYQRSIFFKGKEESLRIASLLVCFATNGWLLKMPNPMNRPAGLDIQLTLKFKEESK